MSSDLVAAVAEFARRQTPSLTVVRSTESESFDDGSVELRDGHVLWKVVRERGLLRLEAAPSWDSEVTFDADLLKRFLGHDAGPRQTRVGSVEALGELMAVSLDDLSRELDELRQAIAAAFDEATWATTRRELMMLGRRRDAELFGRPYRPTDD